VSRSVRIYMVLTRPSHVQRFPSHDRVRCAPFPRGGHDRFEPCADGVGDVTDGAGAARTLLAVEQRVRAGITPGTPRTSGRQTSAARCAPRSTSVRSKLGGPRRGGRGVAAVAAERSRRCGGGRRERSGREETLDANGLRMD
jgi:hypothetical protein